MHNAYLDIQTKLIEACAERDKLMKKCDDLEHYVAKLIRRPWWSRWWG